MNVKRIPSKPVKKRPYGLSTQDYYLARRIANEEGVLPSEAARYVKAHRLNSKKMCPDY